ncbi:MAG: tRNA(Ile)-lysidine synthetase, partial [Lachnospiraceae bacterium]|nr:tRNA(Ile)-lysidine synthetase [Lachnospiraceae bacterium]
METDIGKKVFDFIRKNDLLQKGDAVVAGVSGGADSMCMLLLLKELMEPLDLKLTVVHVDHGIR